MAKTSVSNRTNIANQAHLTGQTLYHRLQLDLRVVRSPAATKLRVEIVIIRVLRIRLFLSGLQSAWMRHGDCRAVAPEFALREELELFMVGVARDRAGRTYTSLLVASLAKVDCLTYVSEAVGALCE